MLKDRNILAQILKTWAQEHNSAFVISAPEPGDEGVTNTGTFLSWVIKREETTLDLLALLDRLELFADNIRRKAYPDGMFCWKCKSFYKYAEPNQPEGSFVCYGCKNNPYF